MTRTSPLDYISSFRFLALLYVRNRSETEFLTEFVKPLNVRILAFSGKKCSTIPAEPAHGAHSASAPCSMGQATGPVRPCRSYSTASSEER